MRKTIIRTGEKADVTGIYAHIGNPKGTTTCSPTPKEKIIPLERGETAPPIKSCAEPALWRLVKST